MEGINYSYLLDELEDLLMPALPPVSRGRHHPGNVMREVDRLMRLGLLLVVDDGRLVVDEAVTVKAKEDLLGQLPGGPVLPEEQLLDAVEGVVVTRVGREE